MPAKKRADAASPSESAGQRADAPGYEDARAELREVLSRLESGGLSLEDSLALWERGEYLADVCQRWLDGASARLDAAIAAHDNAHDNAGDNAGNDAGNDAGDEG